MTFHTLRARGIAVTLDLTVGHIRSMSVLRDDRETAMLHTAPWIDDAWVGADESIPAHLRRLSGDFFCAPFAASDVDNGPPHGWTANGEWTHIETRAVEGGVAARYRLNRAVMGAVVEKRFKLLDGHPFLYQTHVFVGGNGRLPIANHAMVRLPSGGRLAFSRKSTFETPDTPIEPDPARGRSHLACPAQSRDPARFPTAAGGFVDLTHYPVAQGHEDVVMLVEERGSRLGWLAVSRAVERDAFISLKNPDQFPTTVLWFSNGGRHYRPWDGRHAGVLGVEEACAFSVHGHRASIAPNALSDRGIATSVTLDPLGSVSARNVIGFLSLPGDGSSISDVAVGTEGLVVRHENGTAVEVQFDPAFLVSADRSTFGGPRRGR